MAWRAFPDPHSENFAQAFSRHLLASGAVADLALQRAQRAAKQSGERIDQVMVQLGLIAETDLAAQIGRFLGIATVDAKLLPREPVAPQEIPEPFVRSSRILPLATTDTHLNVALVDPFASAHLEALAYATRLELVPAIITQTAFDAAVTSIYGHANTAKVQLASDLVGDVANEADLQRLRDLANEAPVIRQVNQIISNAIDRGASDIHIEPELDALHVRYRIDGNLRPVEELPPGLTAAIASRVKIMSRLDIAERRMPQDGRTRIPVRGVDVDFRVSTLPTSHGESVVMRILDRSRVQLDFEALGFTVEMISALRKVMREPNGIVLVTGPTGSGKTTTLYTALREISQPDVKVVTVEDPIEYQLRGVNQVQTHPGIGLDFPHALRSILRQDPDVIMIGEIRDAETAQIAIQAALTGHLVFSTLHTNSASASITRLLDMGVESYLIASTVKAIMAQRLVRRVCSSCAAPLDDPAPWLKALAQAGRPHVAHRIGFKKGRGCATCRGTGFAGRATIAELLLMDPVMQQLVNNRAPDMELERAARAAGMVPLAIDGLEKAARGLTTPDEILRVTSFS